MLDMSLDGFMSPERGKLKMASYLWYSLSAKNLNKRLVIASYGSQAGGDLIGSSSTTVWPYCSQLT